MPRATLTSKGQMTLPKEVREALKVKPGDRVEFIIQAPGRVLLRPLRSVCGNSRACLPGLGSGL